jgi:hypothetical protein
MAQRYDIEQDTEGLWMVVDRLAVVEYGVPLIDLPFDEADDVVDLLNEKDVKDRRSKGIAD